MTIHYFLCPEIFYTDKICFFLLIAKHWPCVQKYLGTIHYSLMEAQKREMEEADTVTALASLSMVAAKQR